MLVLVCSCCAPLHLHAEPVLRRGMLLLERGVVTVAAAQGVGYEIEDLVFREHHQHVRWHW
jgi:hypothetical protein